MAKRLGLYVRDIDHLVYATPDVEATVARLASEWGVRATVGGQHPGRGTCNALLGLGPRCYLEVVGPDAHQPPPSQPRWFGIDAMTGPRLAAWAVRAGDLELCAARLAGAGLPVGPIVSGSRLRPDGQRMAWRFTDPAVLALGGVAPFFIDWGTGSHPADGLPEGMQLVSLRAAHPEVARLQALLEALELGVSVSSAEAPRLSATLQTPRGLVELS